MGQADWRIGQSRCHGLAKWTRLLLGYRNYL
jgi:hypothetical protein